MRTPFTVAVLALMLLTATADAGELCEKELVLVRHWFHGEPTDQLNHLDRIAPGQTPLDPFSATFTKKKPTDNDASIQVTQTDGAVHDSRHVGSAESIYWVGRFDGELGGNLFLDLHLFSPAPIGQTIYRDIEITVWGDPDWDAGNATLLGSGVLDGLFIVGGNTRARIALPVAGHVTNEVVVQIQPRSASHLTLGVRYGSAQYASGVRLPVLIPNEHC